MNPEHLAPGRRRLLALVILVMFVTLALGAIFLPYRVLTNRYDTRLQRLDEKISTYKAIVRDGEKARQQQRILDRVETANGYFVASDKPALASADLQRRVKLVIEQSGGTVVSSQMLGEKKYQEIDQVVLRVQMRVGVEELQKVFHTLESQSPILILDNALIGARPAGSSTASRGKPSQQQLDVRFDITGFRKPQVKAM